MSSAGHIHQFHSDYVVDWYGLRLKDRQPQAQYIHTCLLCGELRATDSEGNLYRRTEEMFGSQRLWEKVIEIKEEI